MMQDRKKDITVGVLIGNICAAHTNDMLNGLVNKATEEGVKTLFFMGAHANCFDELYYYEGGNKEQKYLFQFNTIFDYATMGKLDLLIVVYSTFYLYMGETKDEFFSRLKGLTIPVLIVGDEYGDYANIISDNEDGISKCMEHLIQEHKCKKIAYLSGPKENNKDARERLHAYYKVMEENGLEVTEQMVEYGDYSENAAVFFGALLDHNPGLDAVVCANDTMALSGYKECRKRGLEPGVDIAITGFDDVPEAKSEKPALTTIQQNSYDLGYMAMRQAVEICLTGEVTSAKVPVYFIHRESCGSEKDVDGIVCKFSKEDTYEQIARKCTVDTLQNGFLYRISFAEDKIIYNTLFELFYYIVENSLGDEEQVQKYNMHYIENKLNELLASKKMAVSEFITAFCRQLADISFLEISKSKQMRINNLLYYILGYMQNTTLIASNLRNDVLQRNIWTTPFITRDMLANIDDEKQMYECLMERIHFMQVSNAYLFLLPEVQINHSVRDWSCPKCLTLVAKMVNGEIVSLPAGIYLDATHGLKDIISWEECMHMAAYALFAGERIYGILLCELNTENITSMYSVSLHVGSALQFIELTMNQRAIEEQLKKRNNLLNMMSEEDALTGLYNRRGFFENAMLCLEQGKGQYIFCIYADLNNLKQINDQFGHKEGDFAIRKVAEYLQGGLRDTDIVGRIGGDEFAALAVIPSEDMGERLEQRIKGIEKRFNDASDKDYYVETSIGYATFRWREKMSIQDMLSQADKMLYENKKNKRKNVRRQLK